MIKTFFVGVKAVIVKKNKALVLKRKNSRGETVYDFPGGRINDSESIEATLKREIEEELSVKRIKIGKLINAYRFPNYCPISGKSDKEGLILLFYRVETNSLKISLSKEHFDHRWISKKDLKEISKSGDFMNHGMKAVLKSILLT